MRPTPTALQVVIGANADQIAGEIRDALRSGGAPASLLAASSAATNIIPTTPGIAAAAPDAQTLQHLIDALGGRTNVRFIDAASSRLRIGVLNSSIIDTATIRSLGLRGVTVPTSDCVHVIVGPAADVTSDVLRKLIA